MQAVAVSLSNKPSLVGERGEVYGRGDSDLGDAYERPVSRLGSARIKINVRGLVFETYEATLAQYPQTLLGNPSKRLQYFDPLTGHYCFDRNKFLFDSILFFYQSHGILAFPEDIPKESFIEEIRFFELQEVDERIRKEIEPPVKPIKEIILPENSIKRKIWIIFEYPDSSALSSLLARVSMLIIIFSTVTFCLETIPSLSHVTVNICSSNDSKLNLTNDHNGSHSFVGRERSSGCFRRELNKLWNTLEAFYVAWFTFEYIMRLFSSPRICKFVKSAMGLVDILAILPYYITAISSGSVSAIPVLGIIRLLRAIRLLKLSRYSEGLQMLAKTIVLSGTDLPSMFAVMFINIILFSSMVFHVENHQPDSDFKSIPDAFWWSVITMTTVGYGDQVPKGLLGKLVGTLCAMSGIVILFCFPAPVLLSHFEDMYSLHEKKKKEKNKKKGKDLQYEENVSIDAANTHLIKDSQKSPSMHRG